MAFEGIRPDITIDSPGNLFVFTEQPYSSDVQDALYQKILDAIRNGGTGLGAEVEQGIWDRARNRLREDMQAEIDRITDMYAAMGCSLPSGPMMGTISRAQQEYGRKLSDLDRDILKEQAELAQKNTQFFLDEGVKFEQLKVEMHNKIMERALEGAKQVAQFALSAFESEVKAYNLQLDQYKTDASVFESKVKANLSTLEQYKTMIEAARLQSDIQSKAIEIYNSQLKGVQSIIEIYKAEMEGARIKSEVQLQRINGYKATVEAYTSRVNANVARFNAYSAQVGGEKAKAELYMDQVNAYTARVKAIEVAANIEATAAKVHAESNQSKVDAFKADVERYRYDIEREVKGNENIVKLYGEGVSAFSAQTKAIDSHNETQYKKFTSQIDGMHKKMSSILEETKQELNRRIERAKVLAETSKSGAQIYGQFGASAMSTMNSSVRLSYDEVVQNSSSETATTASSV